LRWAQTQEARRYELVNGQAVMKSRETVRHVHAKAEAWLALRNAIISVGLPCCAFGGAGVRIHEHGLRQPDVSVQCQPADPDSLFLNAPVIVAEVVSANSGWGDTGSKVGEYFGIATLRHYLIVDPVHKSVIRHSRLEGSEKLETEIHRTGVIELD